MDFYREKKSLIYILVTLEIKIENVIHLAPVSQSFLTLRFSLT